MKRWLAAITLIIILCFGIIVNAEEKKCEVHLIDIGQSDCILIKDENKNYMIDAGLSGTADKVLDYISSQGVEKLEDIIITHYHDDHYGGLQKILTKKHVNRIILPRHQPKFRDFIFSFIQRNKTMIEYVSSSYSINSENINLKVIVPQKEDMNIENNNSIIIYGLIDGVKYVFMSDVEKEREKELLHNTEIRDCDVIKIAHHGLDTSSSESLIKAINPYIALISCDGRESPSCDVISRLTKNKVSIVRTDKYGDIVLRKGNKGKSVEIITNKVIK